MEHQFNSCYESNYSYYIPKTTLLKYRLYICELNHFTAEINFFSHEPNSPTDH